MSGNKVRELNGESARHHLRSVDLAQAACCGIDGSAYDVARHYELDSAILLATC